MIYGYAWYEDSCDFDCQRIGLKKLGVAEEDMFFEKGNPAEQLDYLLSAVVNEGDTIVTTEAYKLTKSTTRLCKIISLVQDKRLELVIGQIRIDCRKEITSVTEGMLAMANAFAQIEQGITVKRTRSGMKKAEKAGKKLGRPAMTRETLPPSFLKYYHRYSIGKVTQEGLAVLCKTSRQTISKYIKIMKEAECEEAHYEMNVEGRKEMKKHIRKRKKAWIYEKATFEDLLILAQKEKKGR